MWELEETLGSQEAPALLLAPAWCLPTCSPPEAVVALVVLSDQSNNVIGSRVLPHMPLNTPGFINH